MMIDMMIKAASMTNLQQKNSFKPVASKNFNEVFNDVKKASVATNEPVKKEADKNEIAFKDEAKSINSSEVKDSNDKPVENEDQEDNNETVKGEAALLQLQQLLSQLQDENIQPEKALELLKEIAGLMESINPELLTGELLKLQETLKAAGLDINTSLEKGDFKLEAIKEIIPKLVEEVEAKISDMETKATEEEALVATEPQMKPTQLKEQQNISSSGVGEEQIDVNEDVLVEKIDLTPKSQEKETTIGESVEASIVLDEIGNAPLNRGDMALNSAKFAQNLEATLEQTLPEVEAKTLIQEVVNKVQILVQKGKSEMKIQLTPENLGTLHINITLEKGNMTAKMFAENQQIKELIEANLNQLKITLGDKGLNINKLEVAVGHNQEDFNRSQYQPQQKNRMKIKRVNQANLVGIEASTFLEEGISGNPYVVNSKFNGLA